MKEIQFQVEINASKEKVWATLWDDITFRGLVGQRVIPLTKKMALRH
ncbi:MAG: hypothetical protein H7X94_01740 [Vallitaleaceae bacterium]|nr:hypothetical protein [Vallitaleaceae bacterium]